MLSEKQKREVEMQFSFAKGMANRFPQSTMAGYSAPEVGCVYAFEMSDATVKIGLTTNVDKREKSVQSAVYLEVKRRHQTGYAPLSFMRQIEARCHATFVGRRERGEFFAITFEEAVAELDSHADEIADALHTADEQFLEELAYYEELRENFLAPKESVQVHHYDDAEFGQFRWIVIDGVVWFVAADMCRILGHTNPTVALAALDDDERVKFDLGRSPVTGGGGETNVVNEFGLYRLIMASRKPSAKKFQRKVYHEILPSIRKYGYYSVKGEEPAKKTLKPLVPVAVVYAVLFANMLVKIGITSDFYRRLKELRKETHQDIVQFVTTPFKTLDDARLLELTLKAKFFNRLVKGEFFNVDFDTVKAALVAPDDKFTKLLSLANLLPDSEEKTRLVLQAASLI